jgi:hypothetical protein
VRSRLAWLAGAVGGVAAYRRLRRRPHEGDPRAAELRRKLDESRTLVEERDEFEAAETPVDAAGDLGPEARRNAVHESGRAAAERMRGSSPSPD